MRLTGCSFTGRNNDAITLRNFHKMLEIKAAVFVRLSVENNHWTPPCLVETDWLAFTISFSAAEDKVEFTSAGCAVARCKDGAVTPRKNRKVFDIEVTKLTANFESFVNNHVIPPCFKYGIVGCLVTVKLFVLDE